MHKHAKTQWQQLFIIAYLFRSFHWTQAALLLTVDVWVGGVDCSPLHFLLYFMRYLRNVLILVMAESQEGLLRPWFITGTFCHFCPFINWQRKVHMANLKSGGREVDSTHSQGVACCGWKPGTSYVNYHSLRV